MIDLVKKAMFTGIGFAALTKDKVDEVAQLFVEQGKLSRQEGEKLVQDIMERSKESQEQLSKQVEALVKAGLEKANVVTADEVRELKEEIVVLKQRVQILEESRSSEN